MKLRHSTQLYPHQSKAVKWAKGKAGAIIAAEMGTGKTITALKIALDRLGLGSGRGGGSDGNVSGQAILVLAPLATLEHWRTEALERFELDSDQVHLYHGTRRKSIDSVARMESIRTKLILSTIQTLRSDFTRFLDLDPVVADSLQEERTIGFWTFPILHLRFSSLILDEGHTLRNRETLAYQAVLQISADFRWILSGTPFNNSRQDIISLALLLRIDPYHREEWWIDYKKSDFDRWKREYFYVILKRDVLSLPSKTFHSHWVELTAGQRDHYQRRMQMKCRCILVKILRLRQACLLNPSDGGSGGNTKFKKALELIEEVPDSERVLIFSTFKQVLDQFGNYLSSQGWDSLAYNGQMNLAEKEAVLERFKSGPRILLITIQSGGVGLNLVQANHVILMDPYWNMAVEEQAIDRVHRIGQTKPVQIHRLLASDTVETWIQQLQGGKLVDYGQFLDGN